MIRFIILLALIFPSLAHSGVVNKENLVYQGSFQVPDSSGTSWGGGVITYNPANASLFISGQGSTTQSIAEISIPSIGGLATLLQSPTDVTEGSLGNIGNGGTDIYTAVNGVLVGGMMVKEGEIIGSAYSVYDAGGSTSLSHWKSTTTLATTGDFEGMYSIDNAKGISYSSGWIVPIPTAWQTALGGDTLLGQGGISIIGRTSNGPAAFAVDIDNLGTVEPLPSTPLLYYDLTNDTLGDYETTNAYNNGATGYGGAVIIGDSILFLGSKGIGQYYYGRQSENTIHGDECDPSIDTCTTRTTNGSTYSVCVDPDDCNSGRRALPNDSEYCGGDLLNGCYYAVPKGDGKGPGAYPNIDMVWAYKLQDLADVKSGTKQPYEVLPYSIWEMPFDHTNTVTYTRFGGASYDTVSKKLYITQPAGDGYKPVIHVFNFDDTIVEDTTYSVGGKVYLLNGTVKLKNNSGDEITLTANSRLVTQSFSFPTELVDNTPFSVTVSQQPDGMTCTVYNSSDTASNDWSSTAVHCMEFGETEPTPHTTHSAFTMGAGMYIFKLGD